MDRAARFPCPPGEIVLRPEIEVGEADLARAAGGKPEAGRGAAERTASIHLRYSGRLEDGLEPFISVIPPPGFPENRGVWFHGILKALFGELEGNVRHLRPEDKAMEAAHRKAVARLEEVRRRFQRGLRPGETLYVKLGFAAGGDSEEYMWVAVNTWRGNRLQGQLSCEPEMRADLRPGQPIEMDQSEVYDWAIERADGTHEGGHTTAVLLGEDPPE